MRLLECLRLRVKDLEFGNNRIVVRDTKGGETASSPSRSSSAPSCRPGSRASSASTTDDLADGFGSRLPPRRHRHASTPAPSATGAGSTSSPPSTAAATPAKAASSLAPPPLCTEQPERRHHCTKRLQRACAGRPRRRHLPARQLSHLPPLLRHPPARRGVRYPHDPGAPRPPGREDDDDLHTRFEPRRPRRAQPCRSPVGAAVSRQLPALDNSLRSLTTSSPLLPPERQLLPAEEDPDDWIDRT